MKYVVLFQALRAKDGRAVSVTGSGMGREAYSMKSRQFYLLSEYFFPHFILTTFTRGESYLFCYITQSGEEEMEPIVKTGSDKEASCCVSNETRKQ